MPLLLFADAPAHSDHSPREPATCQEWGRRSEASTRAEKLEQRMQPGGGTRLSFWRYTGLLVIASVCSAMLAALLHHLSSLPGRYTWCEPIRTLREDTLETGLQGAKGYRDAGHEVMEILPERVTLWALQSGSPACYAKPRITVATSIAR